MFYILLIVFLFAGVIFGAMVMRNDQELELSEVDQEYEILPTSYSNLIADTGPELGEGVEKFGNWIVNKTGAERDLNVTIEEINETAINVTIFFDDNTKKNDWKNYYDDYNKDKEEKDKRKDDEFPVEKLSDNDKLKFDKSKLDLKNNDQQSIVVTYDPNDLGNLSFKLGWESVIITSTSSIQDFVSLQRDLVWTNNNTAYLFFLNSSTNFVSYTKTTDGGNSWGNVVDISNGSGSIYRYDIYYDKWTSEKSGDLIHILINSIGDDDVHYNNLNTTDDQISSSSLVLNGISASTVRNHIQIIRSRDGMLYAGGNIDGGGEIFFKNSSDGVTWTSKSDYMELANDWVILSPGNELNPLDIWAFYWDLSANEISLKVYNSTSDSWNETVLDSATDNSVYFGWDSVYRHSDNASILFYHNNHQVSTQDLRVMEVLNNTNYTIKQSVFNNNADPALVGAMINQQNDELYAAYIVGSTTNADVYYKNSTNNANSWSGLNLYDDHSDDIKGLYGGTSVGKDGGRWQPVFFNDDLNGLYTNHSAGIDIPDNHIKELDILYPTSGGNNATVSSGDNITIRLNVTADNITQTSGFTLYNVTIDGTLSTILTDGLSYDYSINLNFSDETTMHSEVGVCDISTLNLSNKHQPFNDCTSTSDVSSDSDFDLSDNVWYVLEELNGVYEGGFNIIWANTNYNNITDISFLYEGRTSSAGAADPDFYVWNVTGQVWEEFLNSPFGTSDVNVTFNSTDQTQFGISDLVNSSGDIAFAYIDVQTIITGNVLIRTDYTQIMLNYSEEIPAVWSNSSGYYANITVPTKANGTYDLFVNGTYESKVISDTSTSSVIYKNLAGPADTCTPPAVNNNWNVSMGDFCIISTPVDLGTGNLTFYNTGNFTCDANINVSNMDKPPASSTLYIFDQCLLEVTRV